MASEQQLLLNTESTPAKDVVVDMSSPVVQADTPLTSISIKVTGLQRVGLDSSPEDYVGIEVHVGMTKWVVLKTTAEIATLHNSVTSRKSPEVDNRELQDRLEELTPFQRQLLFCRVPNQPKKISSRDLVPLEKYLNVYVQEKFVASALASKKVLSFFEFNESAFKIVRSDDVEALKFVLSLGVDVVSAKDVAGGNVLHYAFANNAKECIKYLASSGLFTAEDLVKAMNVKDVFGYSPISLAARSNYLDGIFDTLTELKVPAAADEKFDAEKDEDNRPPLQYTKAAEDLSWKFIVNPIAGKGRALRVYNEVITPLLALKGCRYAIATSDYAGHGIKIAQELDLNVFDAVVAVGGDGTLTEIIVGLGEKNIGRIPLGVIPSGSGNGIAASLDCKSSEKAVLLLSKGQFGTIDMFAFNQLPGGDAVDAQLEVETPSNGHLILMLAWGMLSDIDFGSEKWRWMGEFRFTLMGAIKIVTNEKYPCELHYLPADADEKDTEEVTIEDGKFVIPKKFKMLDSPDFFCAASGTNIATSTLIAPGASLNDGKLWLVSANRMSVLQKVGFLLGIEDGSHVGKAGVIVEPTSELVFIPKKHPQLLDIDGERYPNVPIHVKRSLLKPRFARC